LSDGFLLASAVDSLRIEGRLAAIPPLQNLSDEDLTAMGYAVRESQPTPNPNALKLLLDREISPEPLSFRSVADAANHPLAAELMAIKGVTSVLMLHDFVTINRSPGTRWADITSKAKRILAKA
jgi:hypothetical protein